MNLGARFGGAGLFVAATIAVAALVHLCVVLVIPAVASRDAYARLAELGPVGATTPLPRAAPGERRFPWDDPALAGSFCRFDLSNGPLRVKAPVGRAGFASLSFHTRHGAVFYALTDRAATHGKMEAVIATAAQLRVIVAHDDEDDPSQDLRVASPTSDGFVVMRAFSELPSLFAAATEEAQTLNCAIEPLPQ
ncbi:MAG: DUF1254 domain-containing protein [Bradyrhizobium sp.]|nr:MAG: DUF1254 domain-containing protein [Bradyrhizobium sp.]